MPDEFSIKINGISLPGIIYGDILEITVDTDVFMPSMFTITLKDSPVVFSAPLLKHTDDILLFRIGASVEVIAKVKRPGMPIAISHTLMKGEITSIEPQFREDGQIQLLIRGYDKSHRLTLGKKTRAWGTGSLPTVTDMEIVAKIAGEHGLIPMVNLTGLVGVIYTYVMQYNQSDWDFLWSRARMLGYQVYVDDSKLVFSPASMPRQLLPVNLTWASNLRSFKPRFVTAGAVTSVIARGWNPDMKVGISGPSLPLAANLDPTSSPTVSKGITGSIAIRSGFSSNAKDYVLDPMVSNPGIGTIMANARFLQHESQYVAASGEADAVPSLQAGSLALITNVGIRFAGSYFVTQARHVYRHGDYKVSFEVSGRNPYTFGHMMGKDPEANKIYGAVVGVVTDLMDPLLQGRLKVKFPWMPADPLEMGSNWARMASLGSGKGGIYFSPVVNDEVLVVFENGDINHPYIVGVLWNGRDMAPRGPTGVPVLAGEVNQRIIRSPSGHVIVLDDTPGMEKILIQDKMGNKIDIDSIKNEITLKCLGNMTLEATGKLTLKGTAGFEISSPATGKLEAPAGLSLKAGPAELALNPAQAALKAPTVEVNGQAETSVKAGAMVQIQGAIVKIN